MAKSVLVVDFDRAIARLVEVNLVRQGYRVRVACDAWSALERIIEERPDLIVTTADIEAALAQEAATRDIPCLVMGRDAPGPPHYEGHS